MIGLIATFVAVTLATSFVCTAVREDEDEHLWLGTARMFGVLTLGIMGFALAVQLLTLGAG